MPEGKKAGESGNVEPFDFEAAAKKGAASENGETLPIPTQGVTRARAQFRIPAAGADVTDAGAMERELTGGRKPRFWSRHQSVRFLNAEEKRNLADDAQPFTITAVDEAETENGPQWVVTAQYDGGGQFKLGFTKADWRDDMMSDLQAVVRDGSEVIRAVLLSFESKDWGTTGFNLGPAPDDTDSQLEMGGI